tara:strand:+ start:18 stop:329 length:312 start_codon:yes stop_codon:yes gene_type:complete
VTITKPIIVRNINKKRFNLFNLNSNAMTPISKYDLSTRVSETSKIKKNARKTLSLVFSTNIEKQLVQITIGNNQDIRTKSSFIERKTAALLSADGNIIRRIKK